jgi:hypothetical protein
MTLDIDAEELKKLVGWRTKPKSRSCQAREAVRQRANLLLREDLPIGPIVRQCPARYVVPV